MRWLRVAFMAVALAGGLASVGGTAWATTDDEGCQIRCATCKCNTNTGICDCTDCTISGCTNAS